MNKELQDIQGMNSPLGYLVPKRFFTLQEAAHYCALAEISIKQAVYKKELPVIQRGPKSKLIFDVQDLDSWMLTDKKNHSAVDTRMRARNGRFLKEKEE